jgi:methyl-accepting chemotaxis protein
MQSTEGARQTLEASNELAKLAVRLNDMVGKFKV